MSNVECPVNDLDLVNQFVNLNAALGPTNLNRRLDQADQFIYDAVNWVAEDPKRKAAAVFAAATIAAAVPAVNHGNHNSRPQSVSVSLPDHLRAAEQSVSRIVLDSASVQLAPPVAGYLQAAAKGQPVPPPIVTTAAAVTTATAKTKTSVTIEAVDSVNAGHGQSQILELSTSAPQDTAKLYDQFADHATTLVAPPAALKPGAKEWFNGQVISQADASAKLKNRDNAMLVSVDPAQTPVVPAAVKPAPAAAETTTTTTPSPAERAYNPTNAVEVVYKWLSDFRYGPDQKALTEKAKFAIMGNLMVEGRMHPGTLENNVAGYFVPIESLSAAALNDRTVGYGLAQWTPSIKLLNVARQLGVNPDTVDGQLTVLMHDMQQNDIHNNGFTYIQSIEGAADVAEATAIMEKHFERPAPGSTDMRITYALQFKAFFQHNVPLPFTVYPLTTSEMGNTPAPTPTTPTTVAPSTTSTTAAPAPSTNTAPNLNADTQWLTEWTNAQQTTTTTATTPPTTTEKAPAAPTGNPDAVIGPNNVLMQSQLDDQYAQYPYGTGSLKTSGCALFSISTVASTLLNKSVTPLDIYGVAQQINADKGQGTEWSAIVQMAKGYGLNIQEVAGTADSFAQVDQTLSQGGMVIIAGTGDAPFTQAGHVLTIRGKDANGNYLFADSNSTTDNAGNPQYHFTADQLIAADYGQKNGLGLFLVTAP